ncbi:conserved hypothetical protein [Vibrio phage 277E43-1]|nr:conserved hypothetical protein [Vibrio phage 277E43-1]
MKVKAPPIEHQTITYFPHYPKRFSHSSYWVCDVTGEKVKLSPGFKEYYQYRLVRYEFFNERGSSYSESHQRVADTLGIGIDAIKKTYQPLLVRMGLIETKNINTKDLRYIVHDISNLNGWLCNDKLVKYEKDFRKFEDKKSKAIPFTYDNLKILTHNQRHAKTLKSNSDVKCSIIESDRLHELMSKERELQKLREGLQNNEQ